MTLASRLLAVFAFGLIATGLAIGFLPAGDCGAAFSHPSKFNDPNGCAVSRAERRGLPVALLGLGLTAGASAVVAHDTARERSSELRAGG